MNQFVMRTGDSPDDMHRLRPRTDKLKLSRSMRRAEVVCTEAGERPMLLAIVYPRDVPADRLQVLTQNGGSQLGRDVTLPCRCGTDHRVNGAKLRVAVLSNPVTRGKVPRIDVGHVAVSAGG